MKSLPCKAIVASVRPPRRSRPGQAGLPPLLLLLLLLCGPNSLGLLTDRALAAEKAEPSVAALLTDAQGIETEVTHLLFYWEEKVSATAFVPHELRYVPMKRGNATVNVKFETIKLLEALPASSGQASPIFSITLQNGKTGQFALAINGSFKGTSDFGEVVLPAVSLKKIVFK